MTTMKKNYITPTASTTLVEAQMLIADSPIVTVNPGGSVNASEVEVKTATSYNVWDDDWSE